MKAIVRIKFADLKEDQLHRGLLMAALAWIRAHAPNMGKFFAGAHAAGIRMRPRGASD
jgi:hypothetical protein